MDWFSAIWLFALGYALLSGRAYFRGFYARDEQPNQYWIICACYMVLAALMPVLRMLGGRS